MNNTDLAEALAADHGLPCVIAARSTRFGGLHALAAADGIASRAVRTRSIWTRRWLRLSNIPSSRRVQNQR